MRYVHISSSHIIKAEQYICARRVRQLVEACEAVIQFFDYRKQKEVILMANRKAVIETNRGQITIELYEDKAPITAGNFIDLIERGFYNGLKFHRYEPGFVIQGGDPRGNGTGGYVDPQTGRERRIKLEVSPELKHGDAGAVAMARSNSPDSASCQFYITLGPAAFLDMNYAVFGRVTDGMDVVKQLRAGDSMSSVTLTE
jgi:cyclophilin family peptidyl-prolyl cis-trans isomerase